MDNLGYVLGVMGIAWALTSVLMLLLWLAQVKTCNASWVDIGWAIGLMMAAGLYLYFLPGWGLRKFILFVLVLAWASRLSLMLLKRMMEDLEEDRRYARIRADWKTDQNLKFFFFFQFQAFLDIVLSVVWVPSMLNVTPGLHALEIFALVLWVIGFGGESVADAQLKNFKADIANKGKTCQVGLWRYSRHPNYFFEWLMWAAYAVFALASPLGWVGIIAPILMYYFLMHVSGVPLAEAQSLKNRGEEYRRYQASTSIFVPWFKKS